MNNEERKWECCYIYTTNMYTRVSKFEKLVFKIINSRKVIENDIENLLKNFKYSKTDLREAES